MTYIPSRYAFHRRQSLAVPVGEQWIGGNHPILVQSMCTTPTQDITATVAQCIALAEKGCEMVRITAPGVKDAVALEDIRKKFSAAGFSHIPLCADIHFLPKAAMEAIEHVEKVRVNPGNFADKKRFAVIEYTDQEYKDELERVAERFSPLVLRAKELGRTLRIGTNHGSLSDRIMNRFGDSPEGMVESAIEFIDIAESHNYQRLVVSMKSSNPKVMVQAYRILVDRLNERGVHYPLHLGVTEAGDGLDGRIKGAAGIGALLEDGIGDTIRVSLTEDPIHEIPVADELRQYSEKITIPSKVPELAEDCDPYHYKRRHAEIIRLPLNPAQDSKENTLPIGGGQMPKVLVSAKEYARYDEKAAPASGQKYPADSIFPNEEMDKTIYEIDASQDSETLLAELRSLNEAKLISLKNTDNFGLTRAYRLIHKLIEDEFTAAEKKEAGTGLRHPLLLSMHGLTDPLQIALHAGGLLIDGIGDAIYCPDIEDATEISFAVLQAVKARITRADYVACPSCGRTLFDLMEVTAHIKEVTQHLDGVSIAIMGCIVNGPGEMADADFGYVGSGPGKITLYRGREAVEKNIPFAEARDRLVDLIKREGMWKEPQASLV